MKENGPVQQQLEAQWAPCAVHTATQKQYTNTKNRIDNTTSKVTYRALSQSEFSLFCNQVAFGSLSVAHLLSWLLRKNCRPH